MNLMKDRRGSMKALKVTCENDKQEKVIIFLLDQNQIKHTFSKKQEMSKQQSKVRRLLVNIAE